MGQRISRISHGNATESQSPSPNQSELPQVVQKQRAKWRSLPTKIARTLRHAKPGPQVGTKAQPLPPARDPFSRIPPELKATVLDHLPNAVDVASFKAVNRDFKAQVETDPKTAAKIAAFKQTRLHWNDAIQRLNNIRRDENYFRIRIGPIIGYESDTLDSLCKVDIRQLRPTQREELLAMAQPDFGSTARGPNHENGFVHFQAFRAVIINLPHLELEERKAVVGRLLDAPSGENTRISSHHYAALAAHAELLSPEQRDRLLNITEQLPAEEQPIVLDALGRAAGALDGGQRNRVLELFGSMNTAQRHPNQAGVQGALESSALPGMLHGLQHFETERRGALLASLQIEGVLANDQVRRAVMHSFGTMVMDEQRELLRFVATELSFTAQLRRIQRLATPGQEPWFSVPHDTLETFLKGLQRHPQLAPSLRENDG